MKIGIDFGTCNSFVATMIGDDVQTSLTKPDTGIPSVFIYAPARDTELCGIAALESEECVRNPGNLIEYIKRQIRENKNILLQPSLYKFKSGTKEFEVSYIVEKIIKHCIDKAIENAIKLNYPSYINPSVIEAVTVTTPAGLGQNASGANDYNKFILQCVKNVTGLDEKNISILEEPKAAALAYFHEFPPSSNQTILVYDLGGGTIDVSIVKYNYKSKVCNILSTSGNLHIGGLDWDKVLANLILKKTNIQSITDYKESSDFYKEIITVKHGLTDREQYLCFFNANKKPISQSITRAEFEECTIKLLRETFNTVRTALQNHSGIDSIEGIDKVILVGGASLMPQVRKKFKALFPTLTDENIVNYKSSMAIAIGAAINANSKIAVKDIATHSYGFSCYKDDVIGISNIILKDTPYVKGKLQGERSGYTPYQKDALAISVKIYEHDELESWIPANESYFRGEKYIFDIPQSYILAGTTSEFYHTVRLIMENNVVKMEVIDEKTKLKVPIRRLND